MITKINQILEILNQIGLNLTLIIAGSVGAFIGRNKQHTFWQQFVTLFTSAFIANYLTPVLIEFLSLSEKTHGGLAFVIGYMGKHALDYLVGKLKKKVRVKLED